MESGIAKSHYELCCKVAEWLYKKPWTGVKYVTVELVCQRQETPGVWGTNGWASTIIEGKTARSDFLADKKKPWRQSIKDGIGSFRWYLVPENTVKPEEVPDYWGIIEHDGSKIVRIVREAKIVYGTDNCGDLAILCSILRREKFKNGIYNYRKQINNF